MTSGAPDLTPAVSGERHALEGRAGPLNVYAAGPADATASPLLLVHSVNAAGSAYEVGPLYEHYRATRPVYALELPGFGFSDRSPREYTPRLMTDAVLDVVDFVCARHGDAPLDALALSLGCEFLARAAVERAPAFRRLVLVSPTGFNGATPRRGPAGSDRGMPGLYRAFTFPGVTQAFYALLTSRPSIRYFLRKTFGSDRVPQGLIDYAWLTSHQPGARHAPYRFVSGYLFSGDAFALYEALTQPVWMCHGVRGDFQDYRHQALLADRDNWSFTVFQSGALPHFEDLAGVTGRCDAFLDGGP